MPLPSAATTSAWPCCVGRGDERRDRHHRPGARPALWRWHQGRPGRLGCPSSPAFRTCRNPLERAWVGFCTAFSTAGIIPAMVNRRLDRAARFAWVAAREAFHDAGLEPERLGDRLAMATGTMAGGSEAAEIFMRPYLARGPEGASPMVFPNCVAVSIRRSSLHGLQVLRPEHHPDRPGEQHPGGPGPSRAVAAIRDGGMPPWWWAPMGFSRSSPSCSSAPISPQARPCPKSVP